MKPNETRTTIDIDRILLKRAKKCCLEAETTLKNVWTALLKRWVAQEERRRR